MKTREVRTRRMFVGACTGFGLLAVKDLDGQNPVVESWMIRLSKAVVDAASVDLVKFVNRVITNTAKREDAFVAARSLEVLYGHLNEIGATSATENEIRRNFDASVQSGFTPSDLLKLQIKARELGFSTSGAEFSGILGSTSSQRAKALNGLLAVGLASSRSAFVESIRVMGSRLASNTTPPQLLAREFAGARFVQVDNSYCEAEWGTFLALAISSGTWDFACEVVPVVCPYAAFVNAEMLSILLLMWWSGCAIPPN